MAKLTTKQVEKLSGELAKELDTDQASPTSLTRMFTFIDILWVDSPGELRLPKGQEPPTEEVMRSRKVALAAAVQAAMMAAIDGDEAPGAGDALADVFRAQVKINLRKDQCRVFLAGLEPLLTEEGPGLQTDEFVTDLAMATFCSVYGAGGQHLEAVFTLVPAIQETLADFDSDEGGAQYEPNARERQDSSDLGFCVKRYHRLFLRDVLVALPDEFIVRQELGEEGDKFLHRCIWSLQQFGLELDSFFPLHKDTTQF